MRKFILSFSSFLLGLCLLFCFQGCDKMSDNGDLDGMWQLMSVNYKTQSGYDSLIDTKNYKAYLAFQLDLARFNWLNLYLTDISNSVIFRFDDLGSKLKFHDFYIYYNDHDSLLTDSTTTLLNPLGIKGIEADFDVIEKNKDRLILQSDYALLSLRKF